MIDTSTDGAIRLITIANPPVNALGGAVRQGLQAALAAAGADDGVAAIVIRGDGGLFSAGADITEFGRPAVSPGLPELLEAIEAGTKPVIAAIEGNALGGGTELALACHYRIATPGARIGLPEVKLGLLPGAGGTQRLPRLIGVEPALAMILSGDPVAAARAHATGLIDRLAEGDLLAAAIGFAREVADVRPLPRSGTRAIAPQPDAIAAFVARQGRALHGRDAPAACIEAITAATTLPLAEGLALERALFLRLMNGRQSQALRHIFFAERAAAKIDDLPKGTPLLPVDRVGIVGAGTMGGGIAMNFLSVGTPVTIVERDQAALDRGVATIRANYERSVRRGRLSTDQVEAAMALLTPTLALEALADADLVIEAVFEEIEVKKTLFARLDRIVRPDAILASNTSYLDIDAIAATGAHPERVLGLHFFSPANVMRLLEVVRGARTALAVLATAMALARRIGKIAVVARVCDGFIGNRMLKPRQDQANALILEGARPADVDRVLLDFGFPMGPFQMADLAGLDLGWNAATSSGATIRDLLCEADRRGQKNGRGFYDYDADRNRTPSAEVEAMIAGFAARHGIARRSIADDEIRDRLLFAMVNEGAKILEEGVAQRPSDIDVVWVNGYGWPAVTGGPMFWADTVGLQTVIDGLAAFRDRLGPDFTVAPLLANKAAAGELLSA
jgi:3-hydroxyacyl-CoA dehydrogenase